MANSRGKSIAQIEWRGRASRSSRRSTITRLSPQSSSLWDYLSTIGGHDLWRSFLHLQPEFDHAADGFGAIRPIPIWSPTFATANAEPISRRVVRRETNRPDAHLRLPPPGRGRGAPDIIALSPDASSSATSGERRSRMTSVASKRSISARPARSRRK